MWLNLIYHCYRGLLPYHHATSIQDNNNTSIDDNDDDNNNNSRAFILDHFKGVPPSSNVHHIPRASILLNYF
jgi:hypothetical protein